MVGERQKHHLHRNRSALTGERSAPLLDVYQARPFDGGLASNNWSGVNAVKILFSIVMPFLLSGCMSQIFLDSVPDGGMPQIATAAATKEIYAFSSSACEYVPAATRYEIREYSGHRWIQRCARIQGFHYQPGSDYLLEVTEYPPSDSGVRLVLEKVITEWPEGTSR
jgi:hypothetical protein